MAAAVATIPALQDEDAVAAMQAHRHQAARGHRRGRPQSTGVGISQTGPVQMPNLAFAGDENYQTGDGVRRRDRGARR